MLTRGDTKDGVGLQRTGTRRRSYVLVRMYVRTRSWLQRSADLPLALRCYVYAAATTVAT